jgi:integrase
MPRVLKLTRRVIEGLIHPPSATGNYYVMEAGGRDSLRGFGVRVFHAGILYVVRWRGKPYTLGRVDHLPIETAREMARVKINELIQGVEKPAVAGRRKTVAELAELFLEQVVAPRNAPRTLEEYRRLWRLHLLPRFGKMRLQEVTPEMVLKMKTEMADRPVAANRALQQLSAAFSEAAKLRWIGATDNPAGEKTVFRYTEDPETRALTAAEYRRFGAALREIEAERPSPLKAPTTAALRLLIYTGARPHEILAAQWAWVDLEARQISWPRAKGDRPGRKAKGRSIYLSPLSVEVIRSLERQPGCPWLIPGKDATKHLGSVDKAWALVCRRAGIEGTTPKSARHAYRSAGPEAGVPAEHMRELMGHASSEMTDEVYLHFNRDSQLRAAELMDAHLGRLLQPAAQDVA